MLSTRGAMAVLGRWRPARIGSNANPQHADRFGRVGACVSAAIERRSGMSFRVALYEGDGAAPFDNADRAAILRSLLDKGYSVSCVRHKIDSGPLILGRFAGRAPQGARDVDGLDP